MISDKIVIRHIKSQDYLTTWQSMQRFTSQRDDNTLDEIWFVEHQPVFTQGQNGKPDHLLNPGTIPVIQVDRGGQVTYHGPGQCVVYTLIDLRRKKYTIRQFVNKLENAVIELLKDLSIDAVSKCHAPGVYVNQDKICSIGLRVKRGCSYHGIALNVDMDLAPFSRINPCGFSQLQMTQIAAFGKTYPLQIIQEKLIDALIRNLGYTNML